MLQLFLESNFMLYCCTTDLSFLSSISKRVRVRITHTVDESLGIIYNFLHLYTSLREIRRYSHTSTTKRNVYIHTSNIVAPDTVSPTCNLVGPSVRTTKDCHSRAVAAAAPGSYGRRPTSGSSPSLSGCAASPNLGGGHTIDNSVPVLRTFTLIAPAVSNLAF